MSIGDMLQALSDAEDAKRYRWLRERVRAEYDIYGERVQVVDPKRSTPMLAGWRERLDAAIDEQMRAAEAGTATQESGDATSAK